MAREWVWATRFVTTERAVRTSITERTLRAVADLACHRIIIAPRIADRQVASKDLKPLRSGRKPAPMHGRYRVGVAMNPGAHRPG